MTGSPPLTWVVGAGGLLGTATSRVLARRGPLWVPGSAVPWGTPEAPARLAAAAAELVAAAGDGAWQVVWCAGAGVPSTPEARLLEEERAFATMLEALPAATGPRPQGALFVASSAGGVHAGSSGPPFTELTPTRPLAPYGESKLRVEQLAAAWGRGTGHPVVVGRLSNLYGVGQDLRKAQGLVSHLCRAQLLRQPVSLYVSTDTVRDYLWADDAALLVHDALQRARTRAAQGHAEVSTHLMATEHGTTIGSLLGELRRVHGRAPQVVHVASAASAWQPRDLRFRSVVEGMPRRSRTPLPVGVAGVLRHLVRQQQRGVL